MSSFLTDLDEIEAHRTGEFFKSSFSGGGGGNDCVETAEAGDSILIRDTKDREAGALLVPKAAFAELITAVKAGELDHLA